MEILRKRIHDLRVDSDMKQSEVADALGVGRSAISVYECGREPPLDVIFKYAELFGVSVEYLLGLSNEKKRVQHADDSAFDAMQTAAADRGEETFSRADVAQLAAAFRAYYQAGAPAGSIPMACVSDFMAAMCRVLIAASSGNAAQLLTACNDVARAGLLSSEIMAAVLNSAAQNVTQ